MTVYVVEFVVDWGECRPLCSVALYKYFKYLGCVMISLSLLTYTSLSHRPVILFVIGIS